MPGAHAGGIRRPSMWPWLVPLAALAAGAIFSSSFRAAAESSTLRSTVSGMPDLIREGTTENAALARQISELTAEVDALTQDAAPRDASVQAVKEKAAALEADAGTLAVRGPAVKVSLDDARLEPGQLPEGASADDVVVHQQDVQAIVNALWAGGAEAMMLQDQRVISTSAVRCVGNTLILQGRVYSPPYVITAIGDRQRLRDALAGDRSVQIYREYVEAYGLGYDVSDVEQATFPAYSGTVAARLSAVARP